MNFFSSVVAKKFTSMLLKAIDNKSNPYHPLVWIHGEPSIGAGTYVGGFSEINAQGAEVIIGCNCDIASFVSINAADSHMKTIGLMPEISRGNICIGDYVFIGSHSVILGGSVIENNSVIAAGSIVRGVHVPPYSLYMNGEVIPGYYLPHKKS